MKIVFFETNQEQQNKLKDKLQKEFEVSFFHEPLSRKNIDEAKDADILAVFVHSVIDQEVIDSLPNLKYIVVMATGFDHVDLEHAKTRGIAVSNIPAYGSRTVAEFAIALMFALSRNIVTASDRIKIEKKFDFTGLKGFDIQGKTLGVIGTGKIGMNVIQMAQGLGMKVIAFDLFENTAMSEKLNFPYMDLKDLLNQSDIVSLHVPGGKDTRHLINMDNIKEFKKGAYLINTSRGEVVDSDALEQALDTGILNGAALDVLESETVFKVPDEHLTAEQELLRQKAMKLALHSKVICTPHTAFYTEEAENSIIETAVDNIVSFSKGQVKNKVN